MTATVPPLSPCHNVPMILIGKTYVMCPYCGRYDKATDPGLEKLMKIFGMKK